MGGDWEGWVTLCLEIVPSSVSSAIKDEWVGFGTEGVYELPIEKSVGNAPKKERQPSLLGKKLYIIDTKVPPISLQTSPKKHVLGVVQKHHLDSVVRAT